MTSDEPTAEAPAPSRLASWARGFVRGTAWAIGLGAVVVGAAVGAWVGPFLRDDAKLDWIVRVVALDWRDFGEDKARSRLQFELDRQRIGLQVRDEDCALVEEGEVRGVRCAWTAELRVPFSEMSVPLGFSSAAEVGGDGTLR